MSRGGGRGRGRGRGGGVGFQMPEHSTLNRAQWIEALREPTKNGGMLYPPLDPEKEVAQLRNPTDREDKLVETTKEMYLTLANGIQHPDGSRGGAPWRVQNERKVVGIEIETYSGRNRERQNLAEASTTGNKFDPAKLYLNKAFFPPSLWGAVFEADELRTKRRMEMKERGKKKLKRIDSDGEDEEKMAEDQEGTPSPSDQDDEFDFEDESDHQDYDANYFDNGEGDDDSAGEEEEGGGFDD